MADQVRVCKLYNFEHFFEHDGEKFSGILGPFFEDLIDAMNRSANITMVLRSRNDGYGEPINGTSDAYSGCIGLLQTNQSDAMLLFTDYPHPASNITQGLVVQEIAVSLFNFYKLHHGGIKSPQIEELFASLDAPIVLLCLTTAVTSICFLFLKSILQNYRRKIIGMKDPARRNRIPYEVLTHMANHGKLSRSSGVFWKTMFMVLSLFSLLVIFFLCSFIKTDLVVISPPTTLRSYQEHLDAKCGVSFIAGDFQYQSFKFAPEGSVEKKLWHLSITKYPMSVVLFDAKQSSLSFKPLAKLAMRGQLSIVLDSNIIPLLMRAFCSLSLNHNRFDTLLRHLNISKPAESIMPLRSQDDEAKKSIKGFIGNQQLSAPLVRMQKALRRFFEAGLTQKLFKSIADLNAAELIPAEGIGNATAGNMDQCINNILFMSDVHVDGIKLESMKNFPCYAAFLISFQLFVLLMEILSPGRA